MNEKLQGSSEITDSTLGEASNIVVQPVTQILSDCLEYISKSSELNRSDCTMLYCKLNLMQDRMKVLSSYIDAMTANGSSSNLSKTGSSSTGNQGCPTHYMKQGFKSIDFIDKVLDYITDRYDLTNKQVYSIKDFLKYTIRAGEKDP